MTTTYKDFKEGISIKDNAIVFDYNSKSGGVTTSFGKTKSFAPYSSQSQVLLGNKVFSAYLSKDKDSTNTIVKAIKGQTSTHVDKDQYNQFINRTALYMARILKKQKIDILVTGESSSRLNDDILKNLKSRMAVEIYPKIVGKIPASRMDKIKIDTSKVTGGQAKIDKVVKTLKQGIKSSKAKGIFKAKDYYKPYLKFLSGFFETLDPKVLKKFKDKNVCIIDDVLSSGSSMAEIMRHIEGALPTKVIGMTVFKTKT